MTELKLAVVLLAVAVMSFGAGALSMKAYQNSRQPAPGSDFKTKLLELPARTGIDTIMLGDSIIQSVPWSALIAPGIENFGVAGDTTDAIMRRLDTVIAANPTSVLLMVGTNDALRDVQPGTIANNILAIVDRLTKSGIEVDVFAIPPSGYPAAEHLRSQANDELRLSLPLLESGIEADQLRDRIHPNLDGYRAFISAVHARINRT